MFQLHATLVLQINHFPFLFLTHSGELQILSTPYLVVLVRFLEGLTPMKVLLIYLFLNEPISTIICRKMFSILAKGQG